jgi:hypothetical protein
LGCILIDYQLNHFLISTLLRNENLKKVEIKYLLIGFLIIFISILYVQVLSYQLIYLDDETLVHKKFEGLTLEEKINFSFSTNYLGGHYYRPLTLLSLVIESVLAGNNYSIYHLTNYLLHIINSVLIYLILINVGYSNFVSLFPVLIFAGSTLHINAVGWIAGRGDLLASLFSLFALLLLVKYLRLDKYYLILLISLFILFALLSKELALLVPFIFITFYLIEINKFKIEKKIIVAFLGLFLVLGVYYILRGLLLEEVHVDKFSFSVYYKNIRILPETISKYFIPISVKALSRFELSTTITGLVIFILLLILPLILTSISKKRYYFGIFIFVFLLIPGMVFRTMGQDGFYYWDCRSYLPSLGLVFVSAEVVQSLSKYTYKKYFTAFFIIYLITLSYFTFSKIKVYENAVTYWESVKADYPSNFLPYVGLFNYYKESNKPDQAELELLKAIEINPKDESLWMILNNFYLTNRKNEEAFFFLKKKIEIEKTLPDNLLESYISVCVQLKRFEDIDYILYNISNYNLKKNKILKTIDYNIKILNQNNLDASALNRMINKYRE